MSVCESALISTQLASSGREGKRSMSNQHPTSNIQHPMRGRAKGNTVRRSASWRFQRIEQTATSVGRNGHLFNNTPRGGAVGCVHGGELFGGLRMPTKIANG